MNVHKRIEIEKSIAKATVNALLDAGYTLGVHDSEEVTVKDSNDRKVILAALFTTDDDTLLVNKDGQQVGWVHLVYGNDGWDVISDYTLNLDPQIGDGTEVQKLIDKYEQEA